MFRFLVQALLVSLAAGFSISAPACASVRSSPAVCMAASLRTNDVVKVISGDSKVRCSKLHLVAKHTTAAADAARKIFFHVRPSTHALAPLIAAGQGW